MCIEPGCKTQPYYNYEGQTKALYCGTHKKENMVDVKHKKCIEPGCKTLPIYNYEGQTKALYCGTHKKENMVDVKHKKCIEPGCKTQPNYNYEGETKALYCGTHKKENMVNVKSKKCIEPGCKTQPYYNYEGQTKALYCGTHKKENMVNVKSKKCIEPGCKTRPIYNYEGQTKALYCGTHKKENMVNVKSKKCIEPGCKTQPNYNYEGKTKALYCRTHKKENMVNVKTKKCKSEWCNIMIKEKYDGYCMRCFMYMFPDKPVSRNYKTKEGSVVDFVKNKFNDLSWIADKTINGGCSKRRPDLLLDLGYQVLIIEVDENQHTDYDCSCETERTMELSQDVGHRPIVFIRFNPDKYIKNRKTITSCWGVNKKGIWVVKKTKQKEWSERLDVLATHIEYWVDHKNTTNKTIETIQLFYDN